MPDGSGRKEPSGAVSIGRKTAKEPFATSRKAAHAHLPLSEVVEEAFNFRLFFQGVFGIGLVQLIHQGRQCRFGFTSEHLRNSKDRPVA